MIYATTMKTKTIPWYRIETKMTGHRNQPWLASQLGVSKAAVTNWKARGGIPLEHAPHISALLDIPLDDLMGVQDAFNSPKRAQKRHLSKEAERLILCVTRLDGLGEPAHKLFLNQLSLMEIAVSGWGVQDMDRGQMTDEIEDLLTALAEATGTHDAAGSQQKRTSRY